MPALLPGLVGHALEKHADLRVAFGQILNNGGRQFCGLLGIAPVDKVGIRGGRVHQVAQLVGGLPHLLIEHHVLALGGLPPSPVHNHPGGHQQGQLGHHVGELPADGGPTLIQPVADFVVHGVHQPQNQQGTHAQHRQPSRPVPGGQQQGAQGPHHRQGQQGIGQHSGQQLLGLVDRVLFSIQLGIFLQNSFVDRTPANRLKLALDHIAGHLKKADAPQIPLLKRLLLPVQLLDLFLGIPAQKQFHNLGRDAVVLRQLPGVVRVLPAQALRLVAAVQNLIIGGDNPVILAYLTQKQKPNDNERRGQSQNRD